MGAIPRSRVGFSQLASTALASEHLAWDGSADAAKVGVFGCAPDVVAAWRVGRRRGGPPSAACGSWCWGRGDSDPWWMLRRYLEWSTLVKSAVRGWCTARRVRMRGWARTKWALRCQDGSRPWVVVRRRLRPSRAEARGKQGWLRSNRNCRKCVCVCHSVQLLFLVLCGRLRPENIKCTSSLCCTRFEHDVQHVRG